MKTEDVIRMARETDCQHVNLTGDHAKAVERLTRFANLVAAAERVECMNIAMTHEAFGYSSICAEIANSISARGEL